MQTSKTGNGKKFSFLKALNKKVMNYGAEAIESRHNQMFLPYYSERDQLGNLLRGQKLQDRSSSLQKAPQQASAFNKSLQNNEPKSKDLEDVLDSASRCSTDSKKQIYIEKKLKELSDLDLNQNIRKALDYKLSDPSRQTIQKNLENIKKNTRMKI